MWVHLPCSWKDWFWLKIHFLQAILTIFNNFLLIMPICYAYATIVIFNSQCLLLSIFSVLYDFMFPKQPPRGVPRKMCSENMQQIYRRTPCPHLFCCKFAAFFQNTFSWEHLWRAASGVYLTVTGCIIDYRANYNNWLFLTKKSHQWLILRFFEKAYKMQPTLFVLIQWIVF